MSLILETRANWPADYPASCPLIGWQNIVTAAMLTAGLTDPAYPVSNLANPATHLIWRGTAPVGFAQNYVTAGNLNNATIDYVGIAKHNLGSQQIPIYLGLGDTTGITALLHFDGVNTSTIFTDSSPSPHVWTASGNAQIDTAQSVFGGASGAFDGTGDWISTPSDTTLNLGAGDFTIDMYIRPQGTSARTFAGQANAAGMANTDSAWEFAVDASPHVIFRFVQGTTVTTLTGTATLSAGTWYHVAAVRSGNTVTLYVNGVQNTSVSISGAINTSTQSLTIGTSSTASTPWSGWIDEFRLLVGTAYWTSNFNTFVFTVPYPETLYYPFSTHLVTDNSPIIIRFSPRTVTSFVLVFGDGLSVTPIPEIAVLYVGRLLVLERSLAIGKGHVPITFGRRTSMVSGMSESGNFLGRIVLGEYRESKAEFEWFTPQFYRSNIDAFLAAAQAIPFFWQWNPGEYPAETGYCWLTNDAEPEVDPVSRRMALTLEMRGIA